jgi:hypothetical protein
MKMRMVLLGAVLAALTAVAGDPVFYPVENAFPGEWFLRSITPRRAKYEKYYRDRLDKLAPQEKRADHAEALLKLMDDVIVSNREEDAAIEKALDWRAGDFTYHNIRFYAKVGCTSWMVLPDASATGAAMLQKNRDYGGQNLLSIRLFRAMPGRYKIVTVGDLWSSGAGAVMNEKGLMIVQNDGPGWESRLNRYGIGCISMLRLLAEQCADAVEAEAMLRKLHARGIVGSSSIYLIADLDRGVVIEGTGRHLAAAHVDFGIEARANNYLLPGMSGLYKTMRPRDKFLDGENRRYTATEFLASRLRDKGLLSPVDLMDCSRLRDPEMEKQNWRQICMKNTIESTLFVPDRAYPEMLSTVFIAIGPPRHTVYLPIPMGVTEFPEELADGDMGLLAFALREKYGLDHPHLDSFKALEKELMDEHFAVREEARKLLRVHRRGEAAALLTENFRKQFVKVRNFLRHELETAK